MSEIRCMAVFGTRPEAIKMAPVVQALQGDERFRMRHGHRPAQGNAGSGARDLWDRARLRPQFDAPGQALGDVVSGV